MKVQSTSHFGHGKKTDNANLSHKIFLRKQAIKDLEEVNVLDLFAGENRIWDNIPHNKYFGVEIEKNKGRNLNADNRRIIPVLDLSKYNVIDIDSYGFPIQQLKLIFENKTLQKGTVIIYTAIGNAMSALNKDIIVTFGLSQIYKKCKTLLNNKSDDLFYGYLYNKGVRKVYEYSDFSNNFKKNYGYFLTS